MLEYYEDLSPYHYGMGLTIPEVINIGWLSSDHQFKIGNSIDPKVIKKLKSLCLDSYDSLCDVLVDRLRGSCPCPVCGESNIKISNESKSFLLGSAEIWIPMHKKNYYYATFGLIIHYIEEHHYQPPAEFMESVLALDVNKEFNGQSIKDGLAEKHFRKPIS